MFRFLRKIKRALFPSRSLIAVKIFERNLLGNLHAYQEKFQGLSFAPVLKANAYGHGLAEVAKILDTAVNVPFFVVDSLFEAKILRSNGVKRPILVIGFVWPKEAKKQKIKNLAITFVGIAQLREISQIIKKPTRFHLKIDTGMRRQGAQKPDFEAAVGLIKSNKNIILEGLCSHLADADGEGDEFSTKQINEWNDACEYFKNEFANIKYFHLSNTPGTKYYSKIQANVCRLGLGLYGYDPVGITDLNLKPAMQLETVVCDIKNIFPGDKVGYNGTFAAEKPMRIAILPIGYYEGVDRRLSNIGAVKIRGRFCPIIGRVSMDILAVDVSGIDNIKMGEKVVVISALPQDPNSALNIAKTINSIEREIMIHLPSQLKREIE